MKAFTLFLFALCLSQAIKAQPSSQVDYDVFASFPKFGGAYGAYIALYADKPQIITYSRGTIDINVAISKTGYASVNKISGSISPEIDSAFVKAILTAPCWQPALFKGKPVAVNLNLHYNVELDKTNHRYIIDVGEFTPLGTPNPNYGIQTKIFNAVEFQPQFPGGEVAFKSFLERNLRYPKAAKKNNIEGRVFIQFVVEKNGRLTNFNILRDPGNGLAAEALRLMKLSPRWKPGIQNGKAVRTQYTAPINFLPFKR